MQNSELQAAALSGSATQNAGELDEARRVWSNWKDGGPIGSPHFMIPTWKPILER
jgi:hypothetical protein